jgi:transposase
MHQATTRSKNCLRIGITFEGLNVDIGRMRYICWVQNDDPNTSADCTHAGALIEGMKAEYLLADRGYDSDAIAEQAQRKGMEEVIPPRKSRKTPRSYDKYLYRYRHWVGNAFLQLRRWRGIVTRYAKRAESFLAAAQIKCLALWLGIL